MFRRLSKTFNRKKDSNGYTNGHTNGFTNGNPSKGAATTNGVASDSSSDHDKSQETSATREDVQNTFEQFAQLIHAAQRPLPNQSGDGAYLEKEEPSSFWTDVKALGLKDVRTIRHIMEDKAAGKPQDDKKMHMEEVIQVGSRGMYRDND
jgi:linoleate 10R-lipoxygenase